MKRQTVLCLQDTGKALSNNVFHDQEQVITINLSIIRNDYVTMSKLGRCSYFANEPITVLFILK